MVDDSTILKY